MKPYVSNLFTIHPHYFITHYYLKFGYKDNTKTEKIQIFLHYFCIFFVSQ